jgi:hypothetical protein
MTQQAGRAGNTEMCDCFAETSVRRDRTVGPQSSPDLWC